MLFYGLFGGVMLLSGKYLLHINLKDIITQKKNNMFTLTDKFLLTGLITMLMSSICVIVLAIIAPKLPETAAEHISNNLVLNIFIGVLIGPIIEELVFRGILFIRLKQYGNTFAVIVTTILFTLMHGGSVHIIIIMVIGFSAGILRSITGNIAYPIILHAVQNSGILLWSDHTKHLSVNLQYTIILNATLLILFMLLCRFNVNIKHKIKLLIGRIRCFPVIIKSDKALYQSFFSTSGILILVIYFGTNILFSLLSLIIPA